MGTKSDMANNTDMDINDFNRTGNTGRARGILAVVTDGERGLRPLSPPWVGRDQNIFQQGRTRGLRPPSPPHQRGRARATALLLCIVENNTPTIPSQIFSNQGGEEFSDLPLLLHEVEQELYSYRWQRTMPPALEESGIGSLVLTPFPEPPTPP